MWAGEQRPPHSRRAGSEGQDVGVSVGALLVCGAGRAPGADPEVTRPARINRAR